ncbi:hypothetical protein ML5_2448 [Micromonospora sp. L5]|nr:hypothetical protein ML5_2448 [Micromonospora sp. L5]
MTPRLDAPIMRLAADLEIHIAVNLMIDRETGRAGRAGGAGRGAGA